MEFVITIPDAAINEDSDLRRYAEALQMMTNRMAVSHFKYGNMRDKYPHSARAIDSAEKRMEMYQKDGNTENLVDAANFLVIEHIRPYHGRAHFRSQTSEESPGIVWAD